jgi:predicted homoserine dehydrogenase-like protein
MVTSLADGSKISFEQTIAANPTGFKVLTRGMSRRVRFDGSPFELPSLYDLDEVRALGGIVDYTVGPSNVKGVLPGRAPGSQAPALPQPLQARGRAALSPSASPITCPRFEAPNAIARVVLLGDGLAAPLGGPVVEVCAVAKRDLKAGETFDDYGILMTYGEAVNVHEMSAGRYCPRTSSTGAACSGTSGRAP